MRYVAVILGFFLLLSALIAAELNTNSPSRRPPELPTPPKHVTTFRELLKMNGSERTAELAKKSPANRAIIEKRLKEFDALSSEEREVRLQRMELRLHLISLVREAPNSRTNLLNQIPAQERKLVEERLRYWDQLPPELQKAVLENEMMLSYLIPGETANDSALTNRLDTLPPNVRSNLVATMERWRQRKPEEQKQIYENFKLLFGLSEKERQEIISDRMLDGCSTAEREQIAKVFKTFETLSPAQQRQCIESVRKFTSMTMEERARFLKNAERWQQMSETERQNWRNLRQKVPPVPLLPPGVQFPASAKLSLTN